MSSVFRRTYTKPIPAGATIFTRPGENGERDTSWVRFKRKGKTVTAPLSNDGTRIVLETDKWYAQWTLPNGEPMRCPGYTDKGATEQLAARKEREAARGEEGLIDPYEKDLLRPIGQHLDDYRRALANKGDCPEHIKVTVARLKKLLAGCNCRALAELKATTVADWLGRLRSGDAQAKELDRDRDWFTVKEAATFLGMKPETLSSFLYRNQLIASGRPRKQVPEAGPGDGRERLYPRSTIEAVQGRGRQATTAISAQTANQYLSHLKSFCRWLVKNQRLRTNPIEAADLRPCNEEIDRRHDRRELSAEELRALLNATRNSTWSYKGLSGVDRYHLYATACGTGFRASALASLTPASFDLEATPPTVQLAARKNKSRKARPPQPIADDLAELLRAYLKDKPRDRRIWGGTWASGHRGAEMMRFDLDAAGVPYVVEGPDGPLFADFHALRHTYITLLARAGVTLQAVQALAGHSSPMQTARYSHLRLHDLAGDVAKLPNYLPPTATPAALAATGTDAGAGKLALRLALGNVADLRNGSLSIAEEKEG